MDGEREEKKLKYWRETPYLVRAKVIDLYLGGKNVVILNEKDALSNDIYPLYRIEIRHGDNSFIGIVDLSKTLVGPGEIGLARDTAEKFGVREGDLLEISHMPRPKSLEYIRKKMDGGTLGPSEMKEIMKDVVEDRLNEGELGALVAAMYIRGLSDEEVVNLTEALVATGDVLDLGKEPIADKHSIGGVANNRVTMILVPIIAAAGVYIPKTSSRAITSASGTADTMEVLAPVDLEVEEFKEVVLKAKGAIAWGGGMNFARGDDKLIKIRHPLSLDPRGILLASILAKKKSVGAKYVIIDIPVGRGAKIEDMETAESLARDFLGIGKRLGMEMEALITDGSEPVGNGVGPGLEARDVLRILSGSGPADLREKALIFAGKLLELCGRVPAGRGYGVAKEILESGKALQKFKEIVELQGGDPRVGPDDLPLGEHTYEVLAEREGKINHIHNKYLAKVARAAGAPWDKGAGIDLLVKKGDKVKKGDPLFVIHAESSVKLQHAVKSLEVWFPIEMQRIVFGEFR